MSIGRNPDGSKDPVDDPNDKDPKDPKDKDKFPPDPEEDPIIEVVATTTTPVTLYLDEVNDVTTDVAVTFDTDDIIKGSDLWEMSNWFSKQKDGSGKQTNFQESVLTSRQRGKTVKPNKDLTYVVSNRLMFVSACVYMTGWSLTHLLSLTVCKFAFSSFCQISGLIFKNIHWLSLVEFLFMFSKRQRQ